MNNYEPFDLERFKAGEPAYSYKTALHYIGTRKNGSVVAEERSGGIVAFDSTGLACLNMKPKLKKVDLSKLPVDTLIVVQNSLVVHYAGEFRGNYSYFCSGANSWTAHAVNSTLPTDCFTIHKYQPWTVWQGGECPIPDGMEFEVISRDGITYISEVLASYLAWGYDNIIPHNDDIIAYRLTGKVLDGWTLDKKDKDHE